MSLNVKHCLGSFFTHAIVPLILLYQTGLSVLVILFILRSVFGVSALDVIAHCLKWSSTFICRTLQLEDRHYPNMSMPISLPSIFSLMYDKVALAAIVIHTTARHTQEPREFSVQYNFVLHLTYLPLVYNTKGQEQTVSLKPCTKPHTAKEAIIPLCSVSVFSSSPGHRRSLSISRHTSKPFVPFHCKRATLYFKAHINAVEFKFYSRADYCVLLFSLQLSLFCHEQLVEFMYPVLQL